MAKRLTSNARWVIALVQSLPSKHVPLSAGYKLVSNTGRHAWDTPESKALADCIDFTKCNLIGIYLIDVAVYSYAKDWQEVSRIAERWFINQKMLAEEDAQFQD